MHAYHIFLLDFLAFPPETVVLEEGSTKLINLYCRYNRTARVDWFKGTIKIVGKSLQPRCDCTSAPSGIDILGQNLTFTNFREQSVGQYGCWATTASGFDECRFNVIIGGEAAIQAQ
jgi:hypothetical protein